MLGSLTSKTYVALFEAIDAPSPMANTVIVHVPVDVARSSDPLKTQGPSAIKETGFPEAVTTSKINSVPGWMALEAPLADGSANVTVVDIASGMGAGCTDTTWLPTPLLPPSVDE